MKKIIILFALILLISISFVYADEPDTIGFYSPTTEFTVDAKTQIQSVKQTLISSDTNRLEIFLSAAISGDSLGIYIDDVLFDTITIQDNVLTVYCDVNISNYDNSVLKFYIYYETNNYLAYESLLLDDKGFYSFIISFTVGSPTPSFIFNLADYISDYERYQKITELYPQLTGIKSDAEFWYELSILENNLYYASADLSFLKFYALSEKYK